MKTAREWEVLVEALDLDVKESVRRHLDALKGN